MNSFPSINHLRRPPEMPPARSFPFSGLMLLSLILTVSSPGQLPSYNIIDLGVLSTVGGTGAAARGINNSGEVSGQSAVGGHQHAFRWREVPGPVSPGTVAEMTDLGVVGLTADSDGRNIASSGTVVGLSDSNPAKWVPGGGPAPLPALAGDDRGSAQAATATTTVGYLNRLIPGWGIVNFRAVKWRGSKVTELHPVEATLSQAFDINSNGVAAGWASATAFGPPHAMKWGGGAGTDMHAGFTGKTYSHGLALNAAGTVVGMAFSAASATDAVPFRSPGSPILPGMTPLPLPPGTPRGRALDINTAGYVVGFGDPGSVAMLWLPDNTPVLLQDRIPAGTGWTLRAANAINDRASGVGEIVGWGILGGQTRAFLLRPTGYHPLAVKTELLDPAAPHSNVDLGTPLLTDGEITKDKTKLAAYGEPAIGLVADGTTRLLLRITTSEAGKVTVSIPVSGEEDPGTGVAEQDGRLAEAGDYPYASSVTVNTSSVGGRNMAFIVYRAPEQLPPGENDAATTDAALKVRFDGPPGTEPAISSVAVRVDRPPVVAMHGLWSNFFDAYSVPGGFTFWAKQAIHDLPIDGPDYPNASHFSDNRFQVTDAIRKFRVQKRAQKIAMVQADVVGHSMGGILSRIWARDDDYRSAANYGEGEINRLITIDSPHCGALLMDAAWELRRFVEHAGPAALAKFDLAFIAGGAPLGFGAVQDLGTQSVPMAKLNEKPTWVRCHAIAGDTTIPVDLTDKFNSGPWATFYQNLEYFNVAVAGNIPTHSDLLVGLDNQLGGLVAPTRTIHDHNHVGAANQHPVVDTVVNLLRSPSSSSFFSPGFSGYCPPQPPLVTGTFATLNTIHLILSLPIADAVVNAGTSLAVEIEDSVTNALTKAVIYIGTSVSKLAAAPWFSMVSVPPALIGDVDVQVIATHADGTVSTGTQRIHVVTSATLNTMTATPSAINLYSYGNSVRARIEGTYSDAVVRDLTQGATGTTWLSSNPGIVTVDANGWLNAVANGTATVTATNSANGVKTAAVTVTVALVPQSDLALDGTVTPLAMVAGESATLSFSALNHGPDPARPASVFVSGPSSVSLTGTTASAGAWNNNVAPAWSVAPLAAGGSTALSVNVTALAPGTGTIVASITGTGRDSSAANNALSIPVRVFADPHVTFAAGGASALFTTEAGVLYTLETSSDLDHWTPAGSVTGDGTEKTFSIPATLQRLYCRIRLTAL